jgi:amidophosphoribosyltransferase
MGGFFGLVGKHDIVEDLFYGTDYHSHLGTKRGGLAVGNGAGIVRYIHNIENAQFRSKFGEDVSKLSGTRGIGVISDYEDQPLLIRSHLGNFSIATVGVVKNIDELVARAFKGKCLHFSEMRGGEINPTELVATLIDQKDTFEDGIRHVGEMIKGSCSILLLTDECVLAARDKYGRTPVVLGKKPGAFAASLETCAFPNLGYEIDRYLGPGEIVKITQEGFEQVVPPGDKLQICSFLWVYYGYPASSYEGINVETVRNRCGAYLARNDKVRVDLVAGIPDSGIGHGLGYAAEAGIPFRRPFVKYTPTWARSFMPQNQDVRDQVARMKLIPIREIIQGKSLLFCEDSIVRGTQLKDTIRRLYESGAVEVHMRPACPPLAFGCKYLNFSRSRSELDLAARKAIAALEGPEPGNIGEYARTGTEKYEAMVDGIARTLGLTTLRYQRLEDLVAAIGLPKEKLCTFCWDGVGTD